jgi:hypothetical protein
MMYLSMYSMQVQCLMNSLESLVKEATLFSAAVLREKTCVEMKIAQIARLLTQSGQEVEGSVE